MSNPTPTTIPNPLHILLLTPASIPTSSLLRLPFFSPSPPSSISSTLTPALTPSVLAPLPTYEITTSYYTASIPIWHELLSSNSTFKTEYTTVDGAGEVVAAVGAWIIAFARPSNQLDLNAIIDLLSTTSQVISHHSNSTTHYTSYVSEPLLIAIALPTSTVSNPTLNFTPDDWEDLCQEHGGWEYIDGSISASIGVKNDYGESTGLARLREALEAHEWDAPTNDAAYDLDKSLEELELTDYDNGDVSGFGEGQPDLGLDVADLDDSSQLRLPILAPSAHDIKDERGVDMEEEDEEHDEVREMEHMMTKLLAVKEWGASLSPDKRKRLAANAVKEIMRT